MHRQNLERALARQPWVFDQIDLAHPPGSQQPQDGVSSEGCTVSQRHVRTVPSNDPRFSATSSESTCAYRLRWNSLSRFTYASNAPHSRGRWRPEGATLPTFGKMWAKRGHEAGKSPDLTDR